MACWGRITQQEFRCHPGYVTDNTISFPSLTREELTASPAVWILQGDLPLALFAHPASPRAIAFGIGGGRSRHYQTLVGPQVASVVPQSEMNPGGGRGWRPQASRPQKSASAGDASKKMRASVLKQQDQYRGRRPRYRYEQQQDQRVRRCWRQTAASEN